jgi:alpha-glucosidase
MNNLAPAFFDSSDAHGVNLRLAGGGHLNIQALEPALFRVRVRPQIGYREPRTWAIAPINSDEPLDAVRQDVPWEGRLRDDITGFSLPAVSVDQQEGTVTLRTSTLQVEISTKTLALKWCDAQGAALAQDRATSAYFASQRTGAVRHYLQRAPNDRYYGLGDKTGPLNLHGRRLRTLALDSLGYDPRAGDPLYKHWPFVLTRSESGAWYGLYYDTLAACTFDLGCEHDNYHGLYRYVEIDDGDLDYYFIAGNSPAEVIASYVRLIGGTHLPPRWSLGYAQTAMGLADAPDAQAQLDAFITRAAKEAVPVSSFHYGSGYSSRGLRRYIFTWNASKFPDPKVLNARFQQAGMRLVANVKPCLLDDHPEYATVKQMGGFINDANTGEPVIGQFWDGVGAHLDFSNPAAVAWWQGSLRRQVLDFGIDAGWNDNNEYAIMDDAASCAGFGAKLPLHRARALHPLLMTRATFEAQAAHRRDEAVYTVTRGGPPGLQRYAQTWTGDNTTSWDSLRWNIRTGLQMSLSGLFNIGHDVGGFAGPVPGPELLVRWVQACCLNPRMVMNSWKADGTINLPWMHASAKADVIAAIKLRYLLMPYLWSLFERAHTHHEPILRPTFYNFPHDETCFDDCDDFMLGADLLVAPVVEAGATERRVYLPAGPAAWFDFYTGAALAAGSWHTVAAPLAHLPLFARSGAAIPLVECAGRVARHDDPTTQTRRFG